jgi:hypothetical protein
VNCPQGAAKARRHTSLHLDESHHASLGAGVFDYEIDISVSTAEAAVENPPPARLEPLLCDPLASLAQNLPCCLHEAILPKPETGATSRQKPNNRIVADSQ